MYDNIIKNSIDRRLLKALVGVIAVILIIFVFTGFYRNGNELESRTVIRPDLSQEKEIENTSQLRDAIKRGKEEMLPGDTVLELQLIKNSGLRKNSFDIRDIFEMATPNIPTSLLDSFGNKFNFAIYSHNNLIANEFFVLIEIDQIDEAIVGMRQWEETLYQDLSYILGHEEISPRNAFQNTTIRNLSARTLFSTDNRMIFIYSFWDESTLFMGTNPETFRKILDIFLISTR